MLHAVRGGLAAGLLFILPGAIVLLALAVLYAAFQDTTIAQAIFYGVKPAVVALVALAVVRLGQRALDGRLAVLLALAAFVAIFFFDLPFPLIILAAALIGFTVGRRAADDTPPPARQPLPAARRSGLVLLAGLVA